MPKIHNYVTCKDEDCDDCQSLVDSGRVCSCDHCSDCIDKEVDDFEVVNGLIYHKVCIESIMKETIKECYNYLVSIFLDYPDEDTGDSVSLLNHYEDLTQPNSNVLLTKRALDLNDKLNFPNEVRIEALKLLIKTFDIKPRVFQFNLSGTYIYNSTNATIHTSL